MSKTLHTVLLKLRPVLSSVVAIAYYLVYVADSLPTEQEKVNAGIASAPRGIVRNEQASDKKNSLYNQTTADGSHFHLSGSTANSASRGRTARYTDHSPSHVSNTTIAGTTTSQTLYNITLQTLYNTTPHAMYNATSQTLYNTTSQILYNTTLQTLYSITPHVTKVSRSEPVSGQAAGDTGGTHSLATVSMLDVESLEAWSRSEANVSVLALKLQTQARSTKRGNLVGLNIMTAYLELQSHSISRFLTRRGMLNFQGASRRQTELRTALRAHKARSSSGNNGRSRQDQAGVFRTLVAARRTAGVALTSARRRRQAALLWNTSKPPGREYIKLESYELHGEIFVIIGSGEVVGGVYNEPLDSRGRYDLYLVSCSEWMSVKKCSASSKSTVLMPNEPFQSGMAGKDWRLANTIAIIVSVLLALLLAATVLGLRLANKTPRWYTRKMDMLSPRPSNITSAQALKSGIERHWSDISQLDQKRHIVTGRELLPADQLVGSTYDTGNLPTQAPNITFRDEFDSLPAYFSGTGYHSIYINYSLSAVLSETSRMRPNNNSSLGTFINASFITGYEQTKRYIAAQSPCSAESAIDFWRLIYQEQVHTVVLLSSVVEDGSIRCFQYWPDIAPVYFGPFRIRHVDQQTGFADFAEYMLALSLHRGERRGGVKAGEEHQVRLLVFTSWYETLLCRDPHPLLELQRRMGTQREPCKETLLVHCENGCGRTAVYIALDILMAAYASKGEVSVFEVVSGMRRERPYMVHTFAQYLLIYIALFEDKHAGDTFLDLQLPTFYHNLLRKQPSTKCTVLYEQFQLLSLVTNEADAPPPKAEISGPQVEQPRGLHIRMGDEEVKWLRPDGAEVEGGGLRGHLDGVVFVDGYKRRRQFILAPSPTEASLEEYWHLVCTNDVRSVIVLDYVNAAKRPLYWPKNGARRLESFSVHRHGAFSMDSTVTIYTVKVKCRDISFAHARLVRVYHCRMWPKIKRLSSHEHHRLVNKKRDDQMIPHSDHYRSLLRVLEQVLAWQQETTHESTPVLLHCSDGFSRSGLMAAVAQMIWRADEEDQVSIYRVVRRLRICCPPAVAHYVQYKFLHRLLWVYTRLGVEEEVPSDGARPCTYNITDNDDNPKTSPEVANTTSFPDSDSVHMSIVHKSETILAHESESYQGTFIN